MTIRDKDQEIRAHWEAVSENLFDEQGLKRTVRDHNLQDLLEEAILSHLEPGMSLLDVGCGDGASTEVFAGRTRGRVVAVDYIEAFAEQARQRLAGFGDVTVRSGDARRLGEVLQGVEPVDAAVSIRCLINFPSAEEQFDVAGQILDHVKPGGLYMLSEGWSECWAALDRMRVRCGLEPMFLVEHNLLISREELVRRLEPRAELVATHSLGFYVFLSRVLQPLVTAPEPPRHQHPVNRVAKQMWALGIQPADFDELGYPGVCVFRKR